VLDWRKPKEVFEEFVMKKIGTIQPSLPPHWKNKKADLSMPPERRYFKTCSSGGVVKSVEIQPLI
jgi:hypothetical protein